MKKRIASIVTALALVLALLPATAMAEGAETYTVSDSNQFHSALKSARDGDVIQVNGSFVLKNSVSNNDSLVIDKAVTIQGGNMTLWYAGILLGADVTFKDITLGLGPNVRPAIMANGHKLTLENVQREAGTRYIHLFCGGQTGETQGDLSAAKQGGHGQITLKGNTNLGLANIYAGSISTDGTNNAFDKPATVTIDETVKGQPIEHIYACGALQTYTSENDWFDYEHEVNPPFASPGNFKVRGTVTFNLNGTAAKRVSGDTGVLGNLAQVNYKGTDYLNDGLLLSNIGGLKVESGSLAPAAGQLVQENVSTEDRTAEIVPVSGGSFFGDNASVGVDVNAALDLQKLGSAVTVGNFTGGGALALGEAQTLTVAGTVSGTTTVGIGGLFNGHSQAIPTVGSTYINAANSTADSFALAAYASRPDIKLVKDESGAWSAKADENAIIVKDFKIASAVVEAETEELPSLAFQNVDAIAGSSTFVFSLIDLTVLVNGTDAIWDEDEGAYIDSENDLFISVADDGSGTGEVLEISTPDYSQPPAGTYVISVTVPAANSGTGQPITRTATLTVKAAEGSTVIPDPVPVNGLVYNGKEQVGVPLNAAYTVTGGQASAIDAGTYTIDIKPADGFTWSDGTTAEFTYTWGIGKAAGPAAPAGLTVTAPTVYGGDDGKVSGTTTEMEYDGSDSFSAPKNCTADETAVPAGNYYIRVKETGNYHPGAAVMVTVPDGPATIVSVAVSSTDHKTSYQVNDTLDVTGLTLTVTMSDNSTYTVPVAAGMVSGFDSSSAAASRTLTVTYGGKTATYTISVAEKGGSTGGGSTGGGSTGGGSTGGGSTGGGSTGGGSTGGGGFNAVPTTNPDGSTTVVVTAKDGTVTTTHTAKNGVKVVTVTSPETDTTAQVTVPANVETATVTIPGTVTSGMVAVDAKTGEAIKLSVPTENGMVVQVKESVDLTILDRRKPFTDIDGHWAKDEIDFATAHDMFQGTSTTTFSPDEAMTRGMIAVVLHNFEGNPEFTVQNSFADVEPGTWYAAGIHWAIGQGIANGYGNGSFGTDDFVTREQLVTFLYRYAKQKGFSVDGGTDFSTFPDGNSVSGFAAEAMGWAVSNGLIVGAGDGSLAPKSNATRAQVASILNRFVIHLTK